MKCFCWRKRTNSKVLVKRRCEQGMDWLKLGPMHEGCGGEESRAWGLTDDGQVQLIASIAQLRCSSRKAPTDTSTLALSHRDYTLH